VRTKQHPQPQHELFTSVNKCLLARAAVPNDDAPMFFELFQGSRTGAMCVCVPTREVVCKSVYVLARLWLLRYLAHGGVRSEIDVQALQRRAAPQLLM
jgi:hypothetical protein